MTPAAGETANLAMSHAETEAWEPPPRERCAWVDEAIDEARRWLLAAQAADGHWCGELEGDTILETEYVLLLHFLGRLGDPRVGKAARYVRRQQLPEGGWAIYPGGPPEVSASVKAYLVLKLAGDDPGAPHMQRARRTILALGGVEACNSFTKIYLAICGQYDWWRCPAVPPEMVLLPRWLYFNLYEMSSWSRGIVVPLSIIWALRPVRPVAAEHGIDELRAAAPEPAAAGGPWRRAGPADLGAGHAGPAVRAAVRGLPRKAGASRAWHAVFQLLDGALKTGERLRLTPFRRRALARAEAWILERLDDSDGLAAIFPPIVNTVFALRCLGYDVEHPAVRGQLRELERLEIEDAGEPGGPLAAGGGATSARGVPGAGGDATAAAVAAGDDDGGQTALRLQPCFSAVWDTALAMHALSDSGTEPEHPALLAARRWLVEREIRRTGDWSVKAPGVPPGGWCFEYRNAFYPDCDDTAEVLTALSAWHGPAGGDDDPAASAAQAAQASSAAPAVSRGVAWLLGMQNRDGGWGAFDRGCDKEILTHVPFADHNALLDPSTADVTGRVVDALRRLGMPADAPELARAAAFLRRQQEADGSWYGRWGCNYVYGTWLALRALVRCAPPAGGADGVLAPASSSRRAAAWLLAHQNEDGGWGESPRSYDDPAQKGIGPSTAAQTAWALMGLFAAGVDGGPAVERGVEHLLRTQRADGSWRDEPWTATGFPRVFYLRYHLYAVYFPLMALAEHAEIERRRAGNRTGRAGRDDREDATTTTRRPPPHPPSPPSPPHAYPHAVPIRAAAVEGAVR